MFLIILIGYCIPRRDLIEYFRKIIRVYCPLEVTMLNEKYHILKSGTDIRGVAVDGVPGEPVNLTDDVIAEMAYGYVLWVEEKLGKKSNELTMAVGHDCRISGEHIAAVVV